MRGPQTRAGGAGRLLWGCSGASTPSSHSGDSRTPATAATPTPAATPARAKNAPRAHVSEEEAQKPRPDLPPEQRALLVMGQPGHPEERWIDARGRRGAGYTLVDLSDDWTPYIFAEQTRPGGAAAAQPLPPHLPRAWRTTSWTRTASRCSPARRTTSSSTASPVAVGAARALRPGRPAPVPRSGERRRHRRGRDRHLRRARRHQEGRAPAGEACARSWRRRGARRTSPTLEELAAKQPALAPKVKMLARRAAEKPAMAAVEQRLTCEGLLGAARSSTPTGIYDDAMRLAVRRFQQKHMIYEANYLRRKTVDALARAAARQRLRRRWCARCASASSSAAAILEDGVGVEGRATSSRSTRRRRWSSCGSTDGAAALAFFKRHPARRVQAPARGGQAAPAARLLRPTTWTSRSSSIAATSGTTCRSTTKGHYKPQPRKKYPSLTLFTQGRRQADAAGALAHDHRRLARRAGGERLRVLPLQGVGRRPARDPQRRLGAGLDRARVDADPHR